MAQGIKDRRSFRGLGRGAPRSSSGPITVVSNTTDPINHVGVAFAIPRRVGPAVVRNRIRRRLRAIIEALDKQRQMKRGTYLIIVRPAAAALSFADLDRCVRTAIGRL